MKIVQKVLISENISIFKIMVNQAAKRYFPMFEFLKQLLEFLQFFRIKILSRNCRNIFGEK